MNTDSALRAVITATRHQPVIFTSGELGRAAREIADRPTHFYLGGAAGLASSTGIGVALQTHGTTVVVDGYGSVLKNLAGIVTAGMLTDLPLVHIVLDDSGYATATATAGRTDLCGLARAAGYTQALTIDTVDGLVRTIRRELTRCTAPVFLRCALREDDAPEPRSAGVAYLDSAISLPGQRNWPPDWTNTSAA